MYYEFKSTRGNKKYSLRKEATKNSKKNIEISINK